MDKSPALALILSVALGAASSAVLAAQPPSNAAQPSGTADTANKVCKWVLSADRGAKPYQLCLSPAAWALRDKIAAKDATRTECHIVPKTGWHFESVKVCMPASEWQNQQQAVQQEIQRIQALTPQGG